jgi:hypothetical protein
MAYRKTDLQKFLEDPRDGAAVYYNLSYYATSLESTNLKIFPDGQALSKYTKTGLLNDGDFDENFGIARHLKSYWTELGQKNGMPITIFNGHGHTFSREIPFIKERSRPGLNIMLGCATAGLVKNGTFVQGVDEKFYVVFANFIYTYLHKIFNSEKGMPFVKSQQATGPLAARKKYTTNMFTSCGLLPMDSFVETLCAYIKTRRRFWEEYQANFMEWIETTTHPAAIQWKRTHPKYLTDAEAKQGDFEFTYEKGVPSELTATFNKSAYRAQPPGVFLSYAETNFIPRNFNAAAAAPSGPMVQRFQKNFQIMATNPEYFYDEDEIDLFKPQQQVRKFIQAKKTAEQQFKLAKQNEREEQQKKRGEKRKRFDHDYPEAEIKRQINVVLETEEDYLDPKSYKKNQIPSVDTVYKHIVSTILFDGSNYESLDDIILSALADYLKPSFEEEAD